MSTSNHIAESTAWQSGSYPEPRPTRLIEPGELTLQRVEWKPCGARVIGTVGDAPFDIAVEVADLLNRKRFCFCLWRFFGLLARQPDIEDWQEQIRVAEGGAA